MKVPILLLALILAPVITAQGNPISVESKPVFTKASEKCIVSVWRGYANVTCTVEYKKTIPYIISEIPTPKAITIVLPFFWSKSEPVESDRVRKSISPSITIGENEYLPERVEVTEHVSGYEVEGTLRGYAVFTIPTPSGTDYTMIASYRQPVINDLVYYRPRFETFIRGKVPNGDFEITFHPLRGVELELSSDHDRRGKVTEKGISVRPAEMEVIAVKVKKGEQGR
jgi:hypothetical protein